MPIYRYRPLHAPCKICGEGFDHSQPASAKDLTECPTCGQDVRREPIHSVNTPKVHRKPSISEAKSAGFTVLKRTSGGEFEKQ